MNLGRFGVKLDTNKPNHSKNGVITSNKSKIANLSGVITSIETEKIYQNPDQARSFIKTKEFEKLKDSIRREGLLHPLIVFKDSKTNKYILKAGHRRLRALSELGINQVDCAVFVSRIKATFAAISTNEFSESIHPIDKGVEVQSIINEFKQQGMKVSLKDIAEFYGVAVSTISEWLRYNMIDKSVRAEIISKGIRSKDFLRRATKICKDINNAEISESRRLSTINASITDLIRNRDATKEPKQIKPKSLKDGPEIRNFIYYSKIKDEFIIRNVTEDLSKSDKKRLRAKLEYLLNQL